MVSSWISLGAIITHNLYKWSSLWHNCYAKPVTYADHMSMLITANNMNGLQTKLNSTINYMTAWFSVDGLSLNIEKITIVKFSSNHLQNDLFQITYQNRTMTEATNTEFLGLELDKYMNWTNQTENVLQKMSSACYAVRSMYHVSRITTIKMIYFAYFHSIMDYGNIFCGNSTESKTIFQLQKKIIRIITGSESRNFLQIHISLITFTQ